MWPHTMQPQVIWVPYHPKGHSFRIVRPVPVGDQIVRVNGLKVDDAIHQEALNLLKSSSKVNLKVRRMGMIPVKERRADPLSWQFVTESPDSPRSMLRRSLSTGSLSMSACQEVRVFISTFGRNGLGCSICKGPVEKPGIFVQSTRDRGVAREAGLRTGDQIIRCNGMSFISIEFSEAVYQLKCSPQLDLVVRRGAGLDLFPSESSGYNSSASSLAGDQSPSSDPRQTLPTLPEEGDDRHGLGVRVDVHKKWDEIEDEWDKAEVQDVHRSREMLHSVPEDDENSEGESDSESKSREIKRIEDQQKELERQKRETQQAERKLQEERKRLQEEAQRLQQERKRLEEETRSSRSRVAEVQAPPAPPPPPSPGSLACAISSEVFRRNQVMTSPDGSDVESSVRMDSDTSDSLTSSIASRSSRKPRPQNTVKRQQHEQLMEEFKRAHQKMFSRPEDYRNQEPHRHDSGADLNHNTKPPTPPPVPSRPTKPSDIRSIHTAPPKVLQPKAPDHEANAPVHQAKAPAHQSSESFECEPPSLTAAASRRNQHQLIQISYKREEDVEKIDASSLDSFTLAEPAFEEPKPPPIYWDKSMSKKQGKTALVSIGSYPSPTHRPDPTKLDFLPSKGADSPLGTSSPTATVPREFLQAELSSTLSRSNLREKANSFSSDTDSLSSRSSTISQANSNILTSPSSAKSFDVDSRQRFQTELAQALSRSLQRSENGKGISNGNPVDQTGVNATNLKIGETERQKPENRQVSSLNLKSRPKSLNLDLNSSTFLAHNTQKNEFHPNPPRRASNSPSSSSKPETPNGTVGKGDVRQHTASNQCQSNGVSKDHKEAISIKDSNSNENFQQTVASLKERFNNKSAKAPCVPSQVTINGKSPEHPSKMNGHSQNGASKGSHSITKANGIVYSTSDGTSRTTINGASLTASNGVSNTLPKGAGTNSIKRASPTCFKKGVDSFCITPEDKRNGHHPAPISQSPTSPNVYFRYYNSPSDNMQIVGADNKVTINIKSKPLTCDR